MFAESDLRPISALQHLAFCERQCCLIHIEQAWSENRLTAEGRILHNHVHEQESESRGDVLIVRGLKLRSLEHGLSGIADVVEFHRVESHGISLSGKSGQWKPFPVEYKRGKPKSNQCDEIQLCAQALCLEEMLGCSVIRAGAMYYGSQHRRVDVAFDESLRKLTKDTSMRLHSLLATSITPKAIYCKKCDNCSLFEICMPGASKMQGSVNAYIDEGIRDEEMDSEMSV
ncbi:MAG: CRISPR-associated protein Cas4 [Chitinispirillaceae bacterium]|nr:CRISPR-associated protein Cas4 [Chitinispirillaceae bacterium]